MINVGSKFSDQAVKYELQLSIEVDGIVGESDIVGALFGQTEGLLEDELELKQLQKSGRIGRIDFKIGNKKGLSRGKITIPSSLNKISTAILAATLETVERVGPCTCIIKLDKIVDVRSSKRDRIAKRASEIMKSWNIENQSVQSISKFVEKDTKKGKVTYFGPDRLTAGPDIFKSQEIIVVEGRADITNLLKMDIENTIALDGTKVPSTIKNLCKNREVTVLLDGDRGGDMILKELALVTDIDFVARAPFRKEVEDLSYKEVKKALDKKLPLMEAKFMTEKMNLAEFFEKQGKKPRVSRFDRSSSKRDDRRDTRRVSKRDDRRDSRRVSRRDDSTRKDSRRDSRRDNRRGPKREGRRDDRRDNRRDSRRDNRRDSRYKRVEIPDKIKDLISDVKQTSNVIFLDKEHQTLATVKTSEAFDKLKETDDVSSIILDGVITQRILDVANQKSVKLITGAVVGDLSNRYKNKPEIATFNRIR